MIFMPITKKTYLGKIDVFPVNIKTFPSKICFLNAKNVTPP